MEVLRGRVKVRPEDFQVEEVLRLDLKEEGAYSYYLLWKRDLNTMAALDAISRAWGITRDRMGFCGFKDRRAVTTQYISFRDGPEEDFEGPNFRLTFLGKGDRPLEIGQAEGNLFTVTLREVSPSQVAKALRRVAEMGFANYFGEQRFASDRFSPQSLLGYLLKGDFQRALREYFRHHPVARGRLCKPGGLRRLLMDRRLPAMERVALKVYLRRGDAERALRTLPKPIKLLLFFSYQSLLWNRVVARFVKQFSPCWTVPFVRGEELAFWTDPGPLLEGLRDLEVPFISEEALRWEGPKALKDEVLRAMAEEGVLEHLEAEVLGLKVFKPGSRRLSVSPEGLQVLDAARDRLTVKFFLPSGSYATVLLLKALTFPPEAL